MEKTVKKKTCEFGSGFAYCLGLFLAHAGEMRHVNVAVLKKEHVSALWFNGAGDHLFGIQTEALPKALRKRAVAFQARVLDLRSSLCTPKEATADDFDWAINEAKDLLREADKLIGIKTIEAQWK